MSKLKLGAAHLLGIAILSNLVVVWSVSYFPYADANNHLARYVLMHDALFGAGLAGVTVTLLPTSYIAIDLLGVLLVHFFSPEVAMRGLASICLIALPTSLYAFAAVAAPEKKELAIVGALLSFNWYFLYGFMNYILGVSLILLISAWWWPSRESPSLTRILALGAMCAALYTVHMSAAALMLLVLGVDLVAAVLGSGNRTVIGLLKETIQRRLASVIVSTVCVAIVAFLARSPVESTGPSGPIMRDVIGKITHFATPFYSFSAPQALVLLAGFGLPLAWMVISARFRVRFATELLLPVVLLLAYVICPAGLFAAFDVDVRFLLPAYLLAYFLPLRGLNEVHIRRASIALLFATGIHAGYILLTAREIEVRLSAMRTVLGQLPPGEAVLPLVADRNVYGRIDPYRHFALWVMIDRKGVAPGLFAGEHYGFLTHFRVGTQPYSPGEPWGTKDFKPLDWARIRRDYRWLVVAGDDARVLTEVALHALPVSTASDVALYRIRDPG